MAFPDDGPATLAGAKAILGIAHPADTSEDAALDVIVAAVNPWVRDRPVTAEVIAAAEADPPATEWPANVTHGANLLVAQCHRVQNQPGGTAAATGTGDPVFVAYGDPTIVMLLKLTAPGVG